MDGRTRILLVEDEAIIALSEQRSLEAYGLAVTVAPSGEAAVAHIEAGQPADLVLMDIDLGAGMDGTEAARAILALRDVPVVFLSGHTEPEVVAKTEGITSYGYIVKNSGTTVLLASLKMAFRLHEARLRLQDEEAHYHSLFENPYEPIWLEDFSALKAVLVARAAEGPATLRAWLGEVDSRIYELSDLVRILDANQAALASIGLGPGAPAPTSLRAYLGPEARGFFTDELCAIAEGRTSFEALVPVDLPGVPRRTYFLRLDAVQGHEADLSRVQVRLMDITATMEARERLRMLSFATDQGPSAILLTDLEGRIVYANAKCQELSGYEAEEVLGRNPRIFQSGKTPASTYAELWATIAAGGTWRGRFHNRRKDGSLYWEEARILAIKDESGRITHYLGVTEELPKVGGA